MVWNSVKVKFTKIEAFILSLLYLLELCFYKHFVSALKTKRKLFTSIYTRRLGDERTIKPRKTCSKVIGWKTM